MTIREYADKVQELADKYPDAIAVYSHEDNDLYKWYDKVICDPTPGRYDKYDFDDRDGVEINAVCIN